MKLGAIALGAAAGLLAGLVLTISMLLLRLLLGVPLPLELGSDRFVPLLPVDTFLRLIDLVGGFVAGKRLALLSFFPGQLALAALIGAAFAFAGGRFGRRRALLGLGGGLLALWLVSVAVLWPALSSSYIGLPPGRAAAVSLLSLLALLALFGVLVVLLTEWLRDRRGARPAEGRRLSRREVLAGAGGALLALAGGGLLARLYERSTIGYDGQRTAPPLDPVTPTEKFYVVTKNFVDPEIDASLWRLELSGLVERPRTYDLEELSLQPSVEQVTTLECISNAVGGGLISNALWAGVPLRRLLERAGVKDAATRVFAHAADGFTHSLPLEKALEPTTLLAYRMNGWPLPDRHGYPLRLIVPGGYGEMSVKWLDRIELVEEAEEGYYEKQGWRAERVHTMSRIDRPGGIRRIRRGDILPASGVAFAGDRGVSRVELSTDGGRSWRKTRIDYRGSRLTWALWSLDWRPETEGVHELVVRATDGDGQLQTARQDGIAPDGASGYHRARVRIVFA
jgi:DMSO/TMAO reductase YedYZ molybdopterin-dependent catalytic subunit